jgi:hypothetical protein
MTTVHYTPTTDNRHFASLADLEAAQAERCLTLRDQPAVLRAQAHFHWWPEAA